MSVEPTDWRDLHDDDDAPLAGPGHAPGSAFPAEPGRRLGLGLRLRLPGASRGLKLVALLALLVLGAGALFLAGTGYERLPLAQAVAGAAAPTAPAGPPAGADRENRRLRAELTKHTPAGTYLVVDRANNRLYLRRGELTLLDATCSSGSGSLLREPDGNRQWIFDTPDGAFRIVHKSKNPVWKKPDWAFVEEGKPVPRDPSERFDYGVLGEYALSFGNGYMIHGTLYERLLGRSVTHGCIRLGAEDLRKVYEGAPIGTPLYIF